jgi:hypothetical protein
MVLFCSEDIFLLSSAVALRAEDGSMGSSRKPFRRRALATKRRGGATLGSSFAVKIVFSLLKTTVQVFEDLCGTSAKMPRNAPENARFLRTAAIVHFGREMGWIASGPTRDPESAV